MKLVTFLALTAQVMGQEGPDVMCFFNGKDTVNCLMDQGRAEQDEEPEGEESEEPESEESEESESESEPESDEEDEGESGD